MTFSTIQLLRFIAAFLVLLFHLHLMDSGYKGVDMFFVISGYVMYLKLFTSPRSRCSKFIIDRFTKIFFLYWMALLLFYLINPFPLNTALFLNSLLLIPGKQLILGMAWTLTHELYFYLLIAAIAYLLPDRYSKPFLLIVFFLSSITTLLLLSMQLHIPGTTFLLGRYTWEFFLGVLSGYLSGKILHSVNAGIVLLVAIITLALILIINVPQETTSLSAALYGLLSMLLICFATAYEKRKPLPAGIKKTFETLGDASYSIYLFELHVAFLIPHNNFFSKAIIVVVSILTGIFINRVIEINGLRWCRNALYKII